MNTTLRSCSTFLSRRSKRRRPHRGRLLLLSYFPHGASAETSVWRTPPQGSPAASKTGNELFTGVGCGDVTGRRRATFSADISLRKRRYQKCEQRNRNSSGILGTDLIRSASFIYLRDKPAFLTSDWFF